MESEKLLSGRLSSDSSFDDIDIEHQIKPQRTRRSRLGKWAFRLLVAWLTIWSTVNISTKVWKTFHKPQRVSCACGSSLAEARALNCRFDPLASAWLRPQCIDEDLTAEFNRAGPEPDGSWNYYTDFEKTGTYTLEQVANLADTGIYYYNTQAWHLAHCTFNWRKSLRSRWTGVVMEARSDTEEHVKHCEAMMKTGKPLDFVGTVSAITFDADAAGLKQQMHENEMHSMHNMHSMHDGDMHDMHSSDKAMHQMHGNEMHSMHSDKQIHQMHDTSMHGSSDNHMHGDDMHPEIHPEMHPEMHPNMLPSSDMHSSNMHPEMHPEMHPSSDMHPEMHPNMHPNMHPDMHPEMHPSSDMHPEMHPSSANMHPSEMHPEMYPNMHPSSTDMHPSSEMHPSADMHPSEMHPEMHPSSEMHPSTAMHPSSDMHPSEMHPDMHPSSADMHPSNMHPEMHPNMHPSSSDMHPSEMHPTELVRDA